MARITRICSLAAIALLLVAPAGATRRDPAPAAAEISTFTRYVRARAADAAGRADFAAAQYAMLLALSPTDPALATRAYRQAMLAGDRGLALDAAVRLDAARLAPPDARLLFVADAVARRDWKAASGYVDAVEREEAFGFLVPVLRAWIAFGARDGDPLARLDEGRATSLSRAYAAEHRALLLIATGKTDEGISALKTLAPAGSGRDVRLRIAAAAAIRDRKTALALLAGDDAPLTAARARIERRAKLAGAIDTPATGIAELLTRVAIDVNRERVTPLSLSLVRMAAMLAPDNPATALVTAELLASIDQVDAAIVALDRIAADDMFVLAARNARVQLLVRKGAADIALAEARKLVETPGATAADWARLGDIHSAATRPNDAADAYAKAVALVRVDAASGAGDKLWSFLLLHGGALEQAGRWPEAKAVLEEAYKLAPDQAVVLNHLGYAQLERRENVVAATALIEQANRLRPDDPAITDSLGWAFFLQGDYARAIATLEKAVTGAPGEPDINEHLGDAYWTVGRRLEARFAWRAAMIHADAEDAARLARKLDQGMTLATAAPAPSPSPSPSPAP